MFKFKKKIEDIDEIAYRYYCDDIKSIFGNSTVFLSFQSFIIDKSYDNNYELYYKIYYIKSNSIIRKMKLNKINEIK